MKKETKKKTTKAATSKKTTAAKKTTTNKANNIKKAETTKNNNNKKLSYVEPDNNMPKEVSKKLDLEKNNKNNKAKNNSVNNNKAKVEKVVTENNSNENKNKEIEKNTKLNNIVNTKEVKKEVKRVINANNGKDFSNYKSKELKFASKDDLHLSIGRVTETTISGIKNKDNSWNISIKLYDKYDFDIKKEQGIVETINNIASKMEDIGILHPYEWDISYNFTYYEE